MLKGLTLLEYSEILNFVMQYHRFGFSSTKPNLQYPKLSNQSIKYIDNCFDSRVNLIWSISFRGLGINVKFSTNHYAGKTIPENFKYTSLYDLIMDYLKGEFYPTKEFFIN